MKQLCLIINESKANNYGIGTYIKQLLSCLRNCEKFMVYVIVLDSQEIEINKIAVDNIHYLLIPKVKINRNEKDYVRYARNISYVISLFLNKDLDIIFHLQYLYHLSLANALKIMYPNSRFIITLHYFSWCFDLRGDKNRFVQLIQNNNETTPLEKYIYNEYLRDKKLFQMVDNIICLSDDAVDILNKYYNVSLDKITKIVNGLKDSYGNKSVRKKKEIKRELGISLRSKVIIYVGRINELKGIEELLNAFKILTLKNKDLVLIITGEGNFNKYHQLCIGMWNKVIFTGFQPENLLCDLYYISDVGVLPSYIEQCSYVGIEMLMNALPLIVTDGIGIREMSYCSLQVQSFSEKGSTYIDHKELAKRIQYAIDENRMLSIKSRELYKEKYSLDYFRDKMLMLYNSI